MHVLIRSEDSRVLQIAAIELILNHIALVCLIWSSEDRVNHLTLTVREEAFIGRCLIHGCDATWCSGERLLLRFIRVHSGRSIDSLHLMGDEIASAFALLAREVPQHADLSLERVLFPQISRALLYSIMTEYLLGRCTSHSRLLSFAFGGQGYFTLPGLTILD